MPQPWPGTLPADFRAAMLKAIVGFAIEIDRIEGKFKMGQNRPVEDRIGTVVHLESSSDPAAHALAELMRKHLGLALRAGAAGRAEYRQVMRRVCRRDLHRVIYQITIH